jgi:hypothetical protein
MSYFGMIVVARPPVDLPWVEGIEAFGHGHTYLRDCGAGGQPRYGLDEPFEELERDIWRAVYRPDVGDLGRGGVRRGPRRPAAPADDGAAGDRCGRPRRPSARHERLGAVRRQ